ncbi:MAG: ImmA/IrrE family metallo-endopeptidase, partial [Actinobacteria bacterium]|nr:ImmA/IrrE family metallo-endopeptidase [Actinomycetota bacterium]
MILLFSQEARIVTWVGAVSKQVLAARVRAAADRAGLRHSDLAERVGLSPPALSRALSGQRDFRSLELALIAEELGVSVESLTSEKPTPGQSVSIAARVQPNASPAVERALDRIAIMTELTDLLSALGLPSKEPKRYRIPAVSAPHRQGEQLAINVRDVLGLGTADLPPDIDSFSTYIEKMMAIDISLESLPPGLDGVSVSKENFRLALVSTRISATRQRWTLAHEIGHMVAEDTDSILVDENVWSHRAVPAETRANAFAAEFLVPSAALAAEVGDNAELTEEFVGYLLGRFRVSLDALAFRLHNAGLVDYRGRDRIRAMSSRAIALRTGRVAELQSRQDRRLPRRLVGNLVEAYVRGQVG